MPLLGFLLERQEGDRSLSSRILPRTATSRSSTSSTSTRTTSPTPATTPQTQDEGQSRNPVFVAIILAILIFLFFLFFLFIIIRRVRRKHKNPKYLPTKFLKKLWQKWEPVSPHWKLPRNNDHFEPITTTAARRLGPSAAERNASVAATPSADTGDIGTATVDRNTSVRSVMTLPAYRPNAHQNEQVLGREGERGGIDVVVEFPETQAEEERLREEEMEALYQVRLARRRENEERDERRRLRREARERGDYVALREIQTRARASSSAAAGRSVEELRAEHERLKRERQRTVSSVSYADLGVARHDGTRIRANSEESERTGLLGDAASFAASSQYHRRDRSASSVISIDTMNSDLQSPGLIRTQGDSRATRAESPLRRSSMQDAVAEGRAGSSPELIDHEDARPHSPPGYENISLDSPSTIVTPQPPPPNEPPPNYSSPVVAQGEGPAVVESRFPPISEQRPSSASSSKRQSSTRVGQSFSDHRTSSSESAGRGSQTRRVIAGERTPSRSPGRGDGGVPQLPSLKLSNLPSIQVDPGSPSVRRAEEERQSES